MLECSDKRESDQCNFLERLEKDREKRLEEAIQATNQSIAGLQAAQAEELAKERKHQEEIGEIRKAEVDRDREQEGSEQEWQEHADQPLNDTIFLRRTVPMPIIANTTKISSWPVEE